MAAERQSPLSGFGTIAGLPWLRPLTNHRPAKEKYTQLRNQREHAREGGEGRRGSGSGSQAMPMAMRSSGRGDGGPGVEITMVIELAAAEGEDNVVIINRLDQAGLGCDLYRNISSSTFASPAAVIPSTSCPDLSYCIAYVPAAPACVSQITVCTLLISSSGSIISINKNWQDVVTCSTGISTHVVLLLMDSSGAGRWSSCFRQLSHTLVRFGPDNRPGSPFGGRGTTW